MASRRTTSPITLALSAIVVLTVPARGAAQVGRSLHRTDPNLASEKELLVLPGVIPPVAKMLEKGRPWRTMSHLDSALAGWFDRDARSVLYAQLFLPIDANRASDQELLLIPGMGARFLRLLTDGRPYPSLAAVHDRIASYLAPQELERIVQYLFVPVDPNGAPEAVLATIPGMTPKIIRTLVQHRPYRTMPLFEKQLAKAAGSRQSATLRRYFTEIPGD